MKNINIENLQKLANAGDIQALLDLGDAYSQGIGVTQDYELAFDCYLKAAEQGHADAQYEMGYILHNVCEGCEEEGIEWWRKAAAQGQEDAVNILKELDL